MELQNSIGPLFKWPLIKFFMRKFILSLALTTMITCLTAQEESKRNSLLFHFGAMYRITPVYFGKPEPITIPKHKVYIHQDRQLTTGGITYGLEYNFNKINAGIQFSSTTRYGYIHGYYLNDTSQGLKDEKSGIMNDFSLVFLKYFQLKENSKIFFGAGHSEMNKGTSYTYLEKAGEINGQPMYISRTDDLRFGAFIFSLGFFYENKFVIEVRNNFSGHHNFDNQNSFWLIEIRVNYFLNLLKKGD